MDCSDSEAKSDENVEATSSVPLSDYAKKLDQRVKKRYGDKIAAIGIDPVLLEGKHFEPDCLPPVEATDILSYLVLETSYYMQKQFKAFRSLEAYNQMVSGFIASVEGHIVANKFVVLAKVRHSQRMNDSFIPIWIITGNDTFCPLFGLQGRTGRILLSHSQRFILSRGLDKDKRSAFVYPGQMHVAFAIVCQASRLWQGS